MSDRFPNSTPFIFRLSAVPVILLAGPIEAHAGDDGAFAEWIGREVAGPVLWAHVIAAAAFLVAAGIVHVLLRAVVRQRARRAPERLDREAAHEKQARRWIQLALEAALPPLVALVWVIGFYAGLSSLLTSIRDRLETNLLFPALEWGRSVLIFLLLFWFLFRLISAVEERVREWEWAEKSDSKWDTVLAPLVARTARLTLPLIAFILALPLLPIAPDSHLFLRNGVSILLIVFIAFILVQLVRALEEGMVRQFRVDVADNLRARKLHTQVTVLRKVAIVAIALLAVASILMVFEPLRRFGTSILASAGIAGIIIGFAAQRSLSTLLAGFQIAITQPIRLDDVVIVENEWGRIEEITLTYVVIRIWDLRRLVLPIHYFIETPFQNWTRTSAEILGTVFIHADYTIPVGELRNELERILKESRKWDGKVQGLQVTDARERTLELRALMSAPNAGDAWDLRCHVREKLVEFIQRNYPQSLPRFRAELDAPKELSR